MMGRELRVLYLQNGTLFSSLAFFALALFCLSLALSPHEKFMASCAPALFWVLAILTTLFSTPLLLKAEEREGILDEILLHPSPPALYLLAKMGAEFLLLGLPLAILSILLSPLFSLSLSESLTLGLTLLMGFPAFSALGQLGGLLTLHARGGGILLSLIILPLTLPLILLGLSVVESTGLGLDSFPSICLLTSGSLFLVILSVGAGNWALRFAVEG
jgi:heme exporter protein B